MCILQFDGLKVILDLGREQIAVLEPDALWRALQVNVNPASFFKAVSAGQARVRLGGGYARRKRALRDARPWQRREGLMAQ